jgi:hypothetical protein
LFIKDTALTSLSGLYNLTSVGGALIVSSNPSLASLSGLENITSIRGYLHISSDTGLTSLNALSNITSIEGNLTIFNTALNNLCALYYVKLDSSAHLKIRLNTSLSMDTAYALENQLRYNGFTGTADISDNNGTFQSFCDNDNEVKAI